jgi:hypothetical protein
MLYSRPRSRARPRYENGEELGGSGTLDACAALGIMPDELDAEQSSAIVA